MSLRFGFGHLCDVSVTEIAESKKYGLRAHGPVANALTFDVRTSLLLFLRVRSATVSDFLARWDLHDD